MDTATSLTILLAAFAGGAISTAFAEWIRAALQARRERRSLLLSLREEVSAWLNSQDDWLVRGQNETLGESPIPMRTPSTVLDSCLLQSARYSSLRGLLSRLRALSECTIPRWSSLDLGRSKIGGLDGISEPRRGSTRIRRSSPVCSEY